VGGCAIVSGLVPLHRCYEWGVQTCRGILQALRHVADVGLVFVVGTWVFGWGNTQLYLEHPDAVYWALANQESLTNGWWLPQVSRSFAQGLGVWSDLHALLFDVPSAGSVLWTDTFSEAIFGGMLAASAYAGVRYLSASFDLGRTVSSLAGLLFTFAIILPSPFMWSRLPLYMRSMPWLLALVSIAIGGAVRALRAADPSKDGYRLRTWSWSISLGALAVMVSSAGLWTPVPLLIPTLSLIIIYAVDPNMKVVRRGLAAPTALFAVAVAPLCTSALSLYRQSAAGSGVSVGSVVLNRTGGSVEPFLFGDLARTASSYRLLVLSVWSVALVWAFVAERAPRGVAAGALAGLVSSVVYGTVYDHLTTRGIEFGPSPSYVVLGAFPLLTVLVAWAIHSTFTIATGLLGNRRLFAWSTIRGPRLLFGLLLLWAAVWTIDNRGLRAERRNLPPLGSEELSGIADGLSIRDAPEFRGRLVLVAPADERRFEGSVVKLPGAIHEQTRHASVGAGIPYLGTYSHMTSESFVAFMSRFFAEDARFVRNWTMATTLDPRIAALTGVSTVLSDRELPQLGDSATQESDLELFGERWSHYKLRDVNFGQYSPTRVVLAPDRKSAFDWLDRPSFDPRGEVILEAAIDSPLVAASGVRLSIERDEIVISARSSGTSLLVLPFEYSACARTQDTDSVRLVRANGIFLGVLFSGELDSRIAFHTSLLRSGCVTK